MFDFLKSLTPDSIYEALILRQVKVAHVNEGRISFVYDGLKKDDGIYRSICDALDAEDGITDWNVNRVTGSITVYYDRDKVRKGSLFDRLIDSAFRIYRKNK